MNETAEEQEGRVVAQFRQKIPADMNKGDGEVLLTLLYKRGMLTMYLDAVARAKRETKENQNDDWSDDEICYKIYFCDYFHFKDDVELDSEGRITFLKIDWYNYRTGYILPPIIDHLQKLQRIYLRYCQLLPIELGNLPLLESITFQDCDRALFENIPEGLLLTALKKVDIRNFERSYLTRLSAFWKVLPDTLEELRFVEAKREQADEILCALQNNDFGFRDSLTNIEMKWCQLNEGHLKRLLFAILPRFANLHTLDLDHNNIKSLQGIEYRIKQLERISSSSSSPPPPPPHTVIPDNKLRKLTLMLNPSARKVFLDNAIYDPKEVAALITILGVFNGVYSIGLESELGHYPSDVEYLLRINHAGRKFIKEGEKKVPGSNKPVIKLALWPKILEKAHSMSSEIYNNDFCDEETKNKKKCATGLFHLVRHFCGPLLAENHRRQSCDNQETSATVASSIAAALSTTDRRSCWRWKQRCVEPQPRPQLGTGENLTLGIL